MAHAGTPDDVLDALAAGEASLHEPPGRIGKGLRSSAARRRARRSGGLAETFTKALALGTDSAGGFLVPPEVHEEIVTLVRNRSAVMRLGPRIVPVEKELDVTSISSGASASYVAENAPIPISEETFAQAVLLRPKELGALVPISNKLLRTAASSPDVEEVIREDLAEVIALREDLAFLQGAGGLEPLGIRNSPGLTPAPDLGPDGGAVTFDDLKMTVANLRDVNAPFANPGWIINPREISTLERLKDDVGRYLADTGLLTFDATGGGGTLLGFKFVSTGQIPKTLTHGTSTDPSYMVFGSDWKEAWLGEEQDLVIELSNAAAYKDAGGQWHSAWQERQSLFRAVLDHDFALRRPQFFTVLEGVRPAQP
jgi:HK97 family phage major capsid protein